MADGARAMDDGRCSMGDLWVWGEMDRERGVWARKTRNTRKERGAFEVACEFSSVSVFYAG